MSEFSRFMRANKKEKENERYAPTESLCDENGKPLEWEFRHITSAENEEIREKCTIDVQVTGKPNVFRPKLKSSEYVKKWWLLPWFIRIWTMRSFRIPTG